VPGPWCFAWTGGLIEEQITLVTTGNTHGGILETRSFVGDVDGGSQIMRLAAPDTLTSGEMYTITGPGIPDGTVTIIDSTISAPGSINLSASAGSNSRSATFVATKAVPVGSAVATLTEGSDAVVLDVDLDAGLYAISGPGIGDADGNLVQLAFLDWDGAAGLMWGLVYATFEGLTAVNTVPVTATATGDVGVLLDAMPSADWYTVTGIAAASLSSLVEGLAYNITGAGIPVGSTFIAPAAGSTELVLDQPATDAALNALLTITGPRTPNGPWDAETHARFDEEVLAIEITQEEGGFATLSIDLKNTGLGLLALGRNLWCWLSWDRAWTPEGDAEPDIVPLFNGRLIGIPKLAAGEVVQLQFLARPDDYHSQKAALAESLQVLPYYDPVWLAANLTPDTVLETYSALWHVDRTSLELTTSDIIEGEDGTVTIGEDISLYDNFAVSYGSPPLVSVAVTGSVSWQQQGQGVIDVTPALVRAFDNKAAAPIGLLPYTLQSTYPLWLRTGGSGMIQCLYGDGLFGSWPKPGTSIGGGWALSTLDDVDGKPLCFIEEASKNNKGGHITPTFYNLNYTWPSSRYAGINRVSTEPEDPPSDSEVVMGQGLVRVVLSFPIQTYNIRMHVEYKADRRRTETVSAVMTADVQRVLSDTADADAEEISLSSDYISQGIDIGGGVPLGDLSYASYFQTDRGARSAEYLFLAARAKMRARARSVDVTFAIPWSDALDIGLRHSVTLLDRRLPGGTCTGKVKSYTLRVSEGTMLGEFTLGCTIGNGTPSTAATGEPTYVDDGYVEPGWQVMAGAQYPLLADEFAYQTLDQFQIDDDGINLAYFTADEAVNYCTVENGLIDQLPALNVYQNTIATMTAGDPLTTAREMQTTVTLDLKPVQGSEFHTTFFPALSQLSLPKTIDLAASIG
jgi:hypothetical protein